MDQGNDEVTLSFGDLKMGVMYPIKEAVKLNRTFQGRTVESVKLDISKSSLIRTTTYVPSGILPYAISNLDAINQAAQDGKCWNVCFYGVVQSADDRKRFFGRLHKHGEGINQALLKEVEEMSEMVSKKRSSSDGNGVASSSKKRSSFDSNDGEDCSGNSPAKVHAVYAFVN